MIDLHTHILPGLDDGSPDFESSLKMADLAAKGGTRYLVATPHSNQIGRFENFYSPELRQLFLDLKAAIRTAHIPLELLFGMEIFAGDDLEEKIHSGKLVSINQSRYYLVEFYFDENPERIRRYLNSIFHAGGVPLIAHPERYYCVQENPALLYEWLQMGCLSQINKGSLFGKFGEAAEEAAKELLRYGLVTCMASDAHRPYWRTPYMADSRDWLAGHLSESAARLLTWDNPQRILNNRPVPQHGYPPREANYPQWSS